MLSISWVCRAPPLRFPSAMAKLVDGTVALMHVSSCPASATRLALCERDGTPTAVDGAWWPKNLDLSLELPDLVAVFGLWIGTVRRVVYDPRAWLPAPRRLIRHSEMVSLDPYRLVFSDTIYLIGTHSRDAVLFVLSPSSSGEKARHLLGEVSASAVPMNAGVLRQLARSCASDTGHSAESGYPHEPQEDWQRGLTVASASSTPGHQVHGRIGPDNGAVSGANPGWPSSTG